jgi:hypothetical protein
MSARAKINSLVKRLVESVRKLHGKKEYRLHFYKGVIRPDLIDTRAANVLEQALASTPDRIRLINDIKLVTQNNLPVIEFSGSENRDEIKSILSTIQDYLRYFLSTTTISEKEVKNGKTQF